MKNVSLTDIARLIAIPEVTPEERAEGVLAALATVHLHLRATRDVRELNLVAGENLRLTVHLTARRDVELGYDDCTPRPASRAELRALAHAIGSEALVYVQPPSAGELEAFCSAQLTLLEARLAAST